MSLVLQKCLPDWLIRAMNATSDPLKVGTMLTLNQFITHTEFKVDAYSMNKFFYNLDNEIPIYADTSVIEWFGYKGTPKKQKEKIINLLKNNFAEYENIYWFNYTNQEYETFYNKKSQPLTRDSENGLDISDIYPNPGDFKGNSLAKVKHLIIHPMIFKHIVLMADTQKSMEIRDYYITLEDLIKKFTQYQSEANKIENKSLKQLLKDNNILMNRMDNKLEIMDNKLDDANKKADEERIRADEERKRADAARDKLIIVHNKLDEVCVRAIPKDIPNGEKTQVWILRDKSAEPGDFNLYPVRTQLKNMNRTISQLKKKWGEELISTYKIEQPNAVLFWTCLKKKYLLNIEKCTSSNWFRLNDMTLNEFKRGINEMDKLRVYDNVSE